jgi:hypothetical protein
MRPPTAVALPCCCPVQDAAALLARELGKPTTGAEPAPQPSSAAAASGNPDLAQEAEDVSMQGEGEQATEDVDMVTEPGQDKVGQTW